MFRIVEYQEIYQPGIAQMMLGIAAEFSETLSANSPDYRPSRPDAYWVALHTDRVIGTVGVSAYDGYAELKRMMVAKDFRGEAIGLSNGLSKQLLQTAVRWSISRNIYTIYLGTMAQFKAAHHFYSKNSFELIAEKELPSSFIKNPVDKLFFSYKYNPKGEDDDFET